jgi:hypothetical protein
MNGGRRNPGGPFAPGFQPIGDACALRPIEY